MHEDVPAARASDRAGGHRQLHSAQQLVILEAGPSGQDHWDAVGRFHEAPKGCFFTWPVGLDDVGAKLSAQADVASQVFESVPLLELVDRGVGRWKFGFRDERDAVSLTCAAD